MQLTIKLNLTINVYPTVKRYTANWQSKMQTWTSWLVKLALISF